nr:MAG TPA: hypothetical protein [Microviridae sp.]
MYVCCVKRSSFILDLIFFNGFFTLLRLFFHWPGDGFDRFAR